MNVNPYEKCVFVSMTVNWKFNLFSSYYCLTDNQWNHLNYRLQNGTEWNRFTTWLYWIGRRWGFPVQHIHVRYNRVSIHSVDWNVLSKVKLTYVSEFQVVHSICQKLFGWFGWYTNSIFVELRLIWIWTMERIVWILSIMTQKLCMEMYAFSSFDSFRKERLPKVLRD